MKKKPVAVALASDREMKRYDQLGPLARAAVGQAHRILNIQQIVSHYSTQRSNLVWDEKIEGYLPLDLNDPLTDGKLAAAINRIVAGDCGKTIEQLTLKPKKLVRRPYR